MHLPTKTPASELRIAPPTECIYSLKQHKERQGTERETAGASRQDSGLVVIKELLGHAHIGVYAHVRLRLQRQAIDTLNDVLGQADDDPVAPPAAVVVH